MTTSPCNRFLGSSLLKYAAIALSFLLIRTAAAEEAEEVLLRKMEELNGRLANLEGLLEQQLHKSEQLWLKLDAMTREAHSRRERVRNPQLATDPPKTSALSEEEKLKARREYQARVERQKEEAERLRRRRAEQRVKKARNEKGEQIVEPSALRVTAQESPPVKVEKPKAKPTAAEGDSPLADPISPIFNEDRAKAADARILPEGSVRARYDFASRLLVQKRYEEAAQAFKEFIVAHPGDKLVTNARYWLAESYYARKDYDRAARLFSEAYEKDKTGPKAEDNLIKLALSLKSQGKKGDSCRVLNYLKASAKAQTKAFRNRVNKEAANC